jgi:peptidoglycan/LPS O-acetylase OafA/YrhL
MQTPVLQTRSHFAGFDGLRLVAAVSVIFSHAFLIATGSEDNEPFVRLLGPNNIAGLYGVFTFFIISGFLLARSLSENNSAITYTVNRVLRILPAFLFYVAVVTLVVGPLFSSLRAADYFSSPAIPSFLKTSLNGLTDSQLPGVFDYGKGRLPTVVNGSLWSLRYEALTYVFLLLLWTLSGTTGIVTGVIATIALLTWGVPPVADAIAGVAYTLPYFAGGVLMNSVHRRAGTTLLGAVASVLALLAACVFGVQAYAFAFFGAYLIVFLGERSNPGSRIADKIGDCSYGLYLYGWPAEQIVKQWTHTTDPMRIFVLAVPPALALAFVSCHLIEKPAMRWRTTVAGWIRSLIPSVGAPRRAAILGARVSFIVGTTLIMLSAKRSWLFLESMGQVLAGVIAGAVIAVALHHAAGQLGLQRPLLWRRGRGTLDSHPAFADRKVETLTPAEPP